jgi:phosphohistidine swiveling domain-containing protein
VLLKGGCTASRGKAAGPAFVVASNHSLLNVPAGSLLVAPQTSPRYVSLLGRVRGIVTDVGSVTGHMASVAREFGVPTLVGTETGTATIPHGEEITVDATNRVVYAGRVEQILDRQRPVNPMKGSPIYKRARSARKKIAVLHLVDPEGENFSPEHCLTLHDVIRFAHEMSMREMFRINEDLDVDQSFALRVRAPLPMRIYAVDLGGGFMPECGRECSVTDVVSVPFRALLQGMTHPNVHWVGAVGVDVKGFMNIVAESAMAGPEQDDRMGGPNYAAVSKEYMNFQFQAGLPLRHGGRLLRPKRQRQLHHLLVQGRRGGHRPPLTAGHAHRGHPQAPRAAYEAQGGHGHGTVAKYVCPSWRKSSISSGASWARCAFWTWCFPTTARSNGMWRNSSRGTTDSSGDETQERLWIRYQKSNAAGPCPGSKGRTHVRKRLSVPFFTVLGIASGCIEKICLEGLM